MEREILEKALKIWEDNETTCTEISWTQAITLAIELKKLELLNKILKKLK